MEYTPTAGLRLTVRGPDGEDVPFTVTGVSDRLATVDFSHPLAGEALTFSVTVRDVQPAREDRPILPGGA